MYLVSKPVKALETLETVLVMESFAQFLLEYPEKIRRDQLPCALQALHRALMEDQEASRSETPLRVSPLKRVLRKENSERNDSSSRVPMLFRS